MNDCLKQNIIVGTNTLKKSVLVFLIDRTNKSVLLLQAIFV